MVGLPDPLKRRLSNPQGQAKTVGNPGIPAGAHRPDAATGFEAIEGNYARTGEYSQDMMENGP